MHPILNIAIAAARNASKIVLRSLDKLDSLNISSKGHNDFVTEVDKKSEEAIIQTIQKAYPDHAILAEESGVIGSHDYTWIIDPLDGTLNFMHGHPHFSITIAVQYKNKTKHGVTYDPLRDELFYASRGTGAFYNNRRIRVASRKSFEGTLIGTGYGHKSLQNLPRHIAIEQALLPQAAGIRRSGSAALDFAYTACGRIDGFWEFNLSPWDIAAGALLVTEAGGIVSDFEGKENFLESGNVIAGNPKIFKALLTTIHKTV